MIMPYKGAAHKILWLNEAEVDLRTFLVLVPTAQPATQPTGPALQAKGWLFQLALVQLYDGSEDRDTRREMLASFLLSSSSLKY